jgi:Ion transport protein
VWGTPPERALAWGLQGLKLLLALVFVRKELRQLRRNPDSSSTARANIAEYFTDPWNLLDVAAYTLLFVGVGAQIVTRNALLADCTNAVVALLLWFKVLYFLRPFKGTGPLINTIFECGADMRTFLMVLIVVVIGFANVSANVPALFTLRVRCRLARGRSTQGYCTNGGGVSSPSLMYRKSLCKIPPSHDLHVSWLKRGGYLIHGGL